MSSGRESWNVVPSQHQHLPVMLLSHWCPGQAGHFCRASGTTERERCCSDKGDLALSLQNDGAGKNELHKPLGLWGLMGLLRVEGHRVRQLLIF